METIEIAGKIAGIGGIALGVLLYVFRDIISQNIFSSLTRAQSERVIIIIIFLTWSIAIAGIASWTYVEVQSSNGAPSIPNPQPESVAEASWDKSGDEVIDRMYEAKSRLESDGTITEAQALDLLRPLFSRPAFSYLAREGDWKYGLFAVCKTRIVLQEFKPLFRNSPDVRNALGDAIELLVQLEREISTIFNPAFSSTEHIDKYIHSKDEFIQNLPDIVREPNSDFSNARDQTVSEIRDILAEVGI